MTLDAAIWRERGVEPTPIEVNVRTSSMFAANASWAAAPVRWLVDRVGEVLKDLTVNGLARAWVGIDGADRLLELTLHGTLLTPLSRAYVDAATEESLGYLGALPRLAEGMAVEHRLRPDTPDFAIRLVIPA